MDDVLQLTRHLIQGRVKSYMGAIGFFIYTHKGSLKKEEEITQEKGLNSFLSQRSDPTVTYDEKAGYQILLPNDEEEAEMPEQAAVLVTAGVRLTSDKEFYNELLYWMEQHKKEQAKE